MRRCARPARADETNAHVTIVRDPLWNNIPLDADAMRLVDTAVFQRLRYVRQLGLAFLVYPGATHSRFEHALGTYHLTGRTLGLLRERGELARLPADECAIVCAAALLHDVGHYPFSHALEEIGALHHEAVARTLIIGGEIAAVLASTIGANAAMRAHAIITGESESPLQGLISGSLDLDKIEYLKRDALMCGVPYGEIDVDRLLHSLTIVEDPSSGALAIGIVEKGLAALESLLFAKYQMYRNVYWHHAVRSATAMYKRLVEDAMRTGAIEERELAGFTDEGLLHRLEERAPSALLHGLRNRRLLKRAFECSAAELTTGQGDWIAGERSRVIEAEDALARELGVAPGDVLLDYPEKPRMLGLDLPVRMRGGEVRRLGGSGWPAAINLPLLAQELYESTRVMRVFATEGTKVPQELVVELLRG
jgi:HD superfamily phosphohydrolase